mmetsp:Transcript_29214/g.52884  ORF Transcript_29214/g.52884 Transcript_29214/m.52884 type:complete len:242 (-) Transcript_29214:383-1108(-)
MWLTPTAKRSQQRSLRNSFGSTTSTSSCWARNDNREPNIWFCCNASSCFERTSADSSFFSSSCVCSMNVSSSPGMLACMAVPRASNEDSMLQIADSIVAVAKLRPAMVAVKRSTRSSGVDSDGGGGALTAAADAAPPSVPPPACWPNKVENTVCSDARRASSSTSSTRHWFLGSGFPPAVGWQSREKNSTSTATDGSGAVFKRDPNSSIKDFGTSNSHSALLPRKHSTITDSVSMRGPTPT